MEQGKMVKLQQKKNSIKFRTIDVLSCYYISCIQQVEMVKVTKSTKVNKGNKQRGGKEVAQRVRGPNARWKNMIPNLNLAIYYTIMRPFSTHIRYRLQKKQIKAVELLIICLLANRHLNNQQQYHFIQLLCGVAQAKISFQRNKIIRLQTKGCQEGWEIQFHLKNIDIIKKVVPIALELVNLPRPSTQDQLEIEFNRNNILRNLLKRIFQCQNSQVGQPGRETIQARKIEDSLDYITKILREDQMNGQIEGETTGEESMERNEVGIQTSENDLHEHQMVQQLSGDSFIDFVMRPAEDPSVESLMEYLSLRQEGKLQTSVVLKCDDQYYDKLQSQS